MTGAGTSALDRVTWPRHTQRLAIRRGTAADTEATWSFRRLDAVSQWLTNAPHTIDEYRDWFEDPTTLAKTLVIELDGTVIGDLMLAVEDAWAQAEVREHAQQVHGELGWALHPDYGGRGYATEAVTEVFRVAFDNLGLRRVTAICFADNASSWRLMERLGMRREAHNVRDSLHRSGKWLDGYTYALLADEWREHA